MKTEAANRSCACVSRVARPRAKSGELLRTPVRAFFGGVWSAAAKLGLRSGPQVLVFGLVAACSLLLAGCQTPPAEEPYLAAYKARNFQQSLKLSEAKVKTADVTPPEKEKASMVAGLSAYAMGNQTLAGSYLRPLQLSTDREVAGRANWTLGQIEAERGNFVDAAKLLKTAGDQLGGDDSARALLQSGDAYARLKMVTEARGLYELAEQRVSDPALKATLDARLAGQQPPAISKPGTGGVPLTGAGSTGTTGGAGTGAAGPTAGGAGGFVIQLGAFEKQESAMKLASQSAGAAKRAGAPSPQVVGTIDQSGRQLFAVRLAGEYATREQAQAVLDKTGLKGAVIAKR